MIRRFLLKIMICVVLVMCLLIGMKKSSGFKTQVYKNVYETNISFGYLNMLYSKYLGNIIPFKLDLGTEPVFNETLKINSKNMYMDGVVVELDNNLIPSLEAGLVVFIGDKEGYGKTIIIEQENGIEVWYGNMENISIELYDYVNKGMYLGNSIDSKLYLVFKQNGNNLNYEDYI